MQLLCYMTFGAAAAAAAAAALQVTRAANTSDYQQHQS
jgi:hypothetical protein